MTGFPRMFGPLKARLLQLEVGPGRTPSETRLKAVVIWLVTVEGIYPGPVQIRRRLGKPDGSRTINSQQMKWRTEVLRACGWRRRRWPTHRRHRWVPPKDWGGRLT